MKKIFLFLFFFFWLGVFNTFAWTITINNPQATDINQIWTIFAYVDYVTTTDNDANQYCLDKWYLWFSSYVIWSNFINTNFLLISNWSWINVNWNWYFFTSITCNILDTNTWSIITWWLNFLDFTWSCLPSVLLINNWTWNIENTCEYQTYKWIIWLNNTLGFFVDLFIYLSLIWLFSFFSFVFYLIFKKLQFRFPFINK